MKTKKKLAARLYDAIFPGSARTVQRHYAAGRLDRKNADWTVRPTSANWEQRQSLFVLRARAREGARNNAHFKKYLSMCRGNIVGPKGFQLQVRARVGKAASGQTAPLDVALNTMVQDAFSRWTHRETCTISGKLDWLGVQRLIVTQLARDGEFLVQKIAADNPFGFALKVWNVDYLSETFNQTHTNGNRIIMSVEIDANDKPVAYWLTTPASDVMFAEKRVLTRTRVPAEEMIHGFLVTDDESQVRGVTWFHAALLNAKHYAGYVEGVVTSARMAAMSFGFLKQVSGEEIQFEGETDDETGITKDIAVDSSPASFTTLPPGFEMQQFDPKQPTQNHPAFAKTMLMDTATGLEIPYFNLSGDMEAVNFSSSRVGLDDSRDNWKGLQDFVSSVFCREVYHAWLRAAVLKKQVAVTAAQMLEVQNPMWRGRGWNYIDPVKDVAADVQALENKTTSWTRVMAAKGVDLVDFFEELQSEQELAKKYGIDLTAITSVKIADNGTAPADESGTPAPAPSKTKAAGS